MRRTLIGISILTVTLLTSPLTVDAQVVTYIYDELGRLVGTIDPNGETAAYRYDSVGNILSITRRGPSDPTSIIEFTPNSAPKGTSVTIYGTGFSTTPNQNTIKFNGVTATIFTVASANEISAKVPQMASTGPISVTSPSGTGTSADPFIVTTSTSAPTITNFTPVISTAGTTVNITGTGFETTAANNKVSFHSKRPASVSSSTTTTINTSTPTGSTSGKLTVETTKGKVISSQDMFVPPAPYTAANVSHTSRMVLGGTQTVTFSVASKIGLVLFEGSPGKRVSLKTTNSTIALTYLTIKNPDGTNLINSGAVGTGDGFFDTKTLPAYGTYTIVVDPESTYTGSITLNLYDVPPDVTGSITPGGSSVAMSLVTAGQNAVLSFSGTANQRISLKTTNSTITLTYVSVRKPDGSNLVTPVGFGTFPGFIDTTTLPVTGTYTILVDPTGYYTGSITVTLYDVPADVTGPITPGGSAVTVNPATPGQNAVLSFSGTANQRISLKTTDSTITLTYVSVKKPDGSNLVTPVGFGTFPGFIDTTTLPVTGTYTILVDPATDYTGSITVTLYDVPADTTGTVTVNGAAVAVTITTPGQNGSLTFGGTSGHLATVRITGNTMSAVTVKLLKPDGVELTSSTSSSSAFNLAQQSLPTTGTYTIVIDASTFSTGSMNVSVTEP